MAEKKKYRTGTNISNEWREIFEALVSGQYSNFALFSCFVNNEPACAIVTVNQEKADGDYFIHPLFVTVTPGMKIIDHEGTAPDIETPTIQTK